MKKISKKIVENTSTAWSHLFEIYCNTKDMTPAKFAEILKKETDAYEDMTISELAEEISENTEWYNVCEDGLVVWVDGE